MEAKQTDLKKSARRLKAEGKLTEEGVHKLSKATREAIKAREETKINRVHGGRKASVTNDLDLGIPVWKDGKFYESRYVEGLYRDKIIDIDVICV